MLPNGRPSHCGRAGRRRGRPPRWESEGFPEILSGLVLIQHRPDWVLSSPATREVSRAFSVEEETTGREGRKGIEFSLQSLRHRLQEGNRQSCGSRRHGQLRQGGGVVAEGFPDWKRCLG